MRLTDFTAFAGEICLYMSVAGFLLSGPGETGRVLLCAAVSLLAESACALCRDRRGAARYLPALLMLPLFFTVRSIAGALLPVPILMLILLRCRAGQWRAEYYTVRSLFKAGGMICPILFLSLAVNENFERLAADSLPFFVAWLLLTVLNLRLLRNQYVVNLDGRFKALNVALILCVALIGIALSSDLPVAAVTAILKAAWIHVVWPILFAVIYVIALLAATVVYLIGRLFLASGAGTGEIGAPPPDAALMQDIFGDGAFGDEDPSRWPVRVAMAVGILLFLLIAWFVVRALVSRPAAEPEISGEIRRENLPPAAKRPRRRAAAGGVRAVYRRYLALCAALHIPVDGSVASDVIRDHSASHVGAEDAGELRGLWLRARFSGEEMSPGDTKRARQLLRRMREMSAGVKRSERGPK